MECGMNESTYVSGTTLCDSGMVWGGKVWNVRV